MHRNTQHSSQSWLLITPHQKKKTLIIHSTNITAPYVFDEKEPVFINDYWCCT